MANQTGVAVGTVQAKRAVFNKEMGTRLRRLREDAGLTQTELARALGYINDSMVCQIESGRRSMHAGHALDAANALGVSLETLFGVDSGEATTKPEPRWH